MDYYRGRKIDKKFKEEVAKNSAIRGYKNAVKIFIYRQDLELEAYGEREKELEKFDKEHPNWEQLINA